MEPNIWGPGAWTFLHSITFQYPETPTDIDKQKYYTFFNSLKNVLPCPVCREHYTNNLEVLQIRLDTRKDLIEWLIDIHNEINIMNNKKVYTYEEVYEIYNKMYDNTNVQNNRGKVDYLFVLFIISICLGGYYYYQNYYVKKK
tara:strand:+ start:1394 stop:1822 length:429 start_codon:yes stop_codon:yes gene_type:complete